MIAEKSGKLHASRSRIERAYQRAMNIRDSVRTDMTEKEENDYARVYRRAYRIGDADGFSAATRKYLRNMRSLSKAVAVMQAIEHQIRENYRHTLRERTSNMFGCGPC